MKALSVVVAVVLSCGMAHGATHIQLYNSHDFAFQASARSTYTRALVRPGMDRQPPLRCAAPCAQAHRQLKEDPFGKAPAVLVAR